MTSTIRSLLFAGAGLLIAVPLMAHAQTGSVSASQAETIAEGAVGSGSTWTAVSSSTFDGQSAWAVQVQSAQGTTYLVTVLTASGQVASLNATTSGTGTSSPSTTTSGPVSQQTAETTAAAAVGTGAQAQQATTSTYQGQTTWDVRVVSAQGVAYDVQVAAATGAVLAQTEVSSTTQGSGTTSGIVTSLSGSTSGSGVIGIGGGTPEIEAEGSASSSGDGTSGDGTSGDASTSESGDLSAATSGDGSGSDSQSLSLGLSTGPFAGLTMGQQLTTIPAALQSYVTAAQGAAAAQSGQSMTVNWVSLSQGDSGLKLKVNLSGGTVVDVLSPSGTLVQQKVDVSSGSSSGDGGGD